MIIDGLPGGGAEKRFLHSPWVNRNGASGLYSLCGKCATTPSRKASIIRLFQDTCKTVAKADGDPTPRQPFDQAIEQAERSGKFDVVFSHLHKTDRIWHTAARWNVTKSGFACMACSRFPICRHRRGTFALV